MIEWLAGPIDRPVQRSVTCTTTPSFRPTSDHIAVMGVVPLPVLSSSSTISPPSNGPVHTCSGIEASTAGGGGGGGGWVLRAVARHHGVFGGKPGIIGSKAVSPFGMLVIAEVNCPNEFKYL